MTLMIAMALVLMIGSASAVAQPAWRMDALSNTAVAPGATLDYVVQATNVGNEATDGSAITLTATLPAGMTAVDASVRIQSPFGIGYDTFPCTAGDGSSPVAGASDVSCTTNAVLAQFGSGLNIVGYELLDLTVSVDAGAAGTLTSAFAVSGGGASAPASTIDPVTITDAPPAFGFDASDTQLLDGSGGASTRAGAHPDAMSVSFDFATATDPQQGHTWPVAPVKDLAVDLPPGLVGDPTAVDACTATELVNSQGSRSLPLCPSTSQIGTLMIRLNQGRGTFVSVLGPISVYNMVPPPDAPARIGFDVLGSVVALDAHLRTGGDYGLTVRGRNIPEGVTLIGTTMTLWGVPASPAHDAERACPGMDPPVFGGPGCATNTAQEAFLRNPTSCTAAGAGLPFSATIDSWFDPSTSVTASWSAHQAPGYPTAPAGWGAPAGIENCGGVPFDPVFAGTPTSPQAGSPSGFEFDLRLPQTKDPLQIGESDLKQAIVSLPAGVRVSPSSADGLAACSSSQIRLSDASSPGCPDASKIGVVTIETPLLEKPLEGSVYLASPHDNPAGSLLGTYIVVEGAGVVLKQFGQVAADPVTGQLTVTFDDIPQLPFSDLHLQLFGGPRAPLVTPSRCGTYTTQALLTGWNGKVVSSNSHFTVGEGSNGGACPVASFAPGFTAGTVNPVAGAFSPFALQLRRSDTDSEFNALSLNLPPGLLADLASVPVRCSDAQAAAAACPADSHIGTVTVGAGAGSNPYYVNGDVYLTGPYKGGPFGLAVVVHAQAGPVDLGYVVVRAALHVHSDGSVTTVTDPFPRILEGIPLQVRDIRVNIDRPRFILNPTSCTTTSFAGLVSSTDGQTADLNSRFQVGECAALGFRPSFRVSTQARTSKANGASLDVKVTSGAGQANLAKTIVTLPKQLPARLTTIQKACPEATFAANPATCPAESAIGTATARTPILASPVSGPAYLVSHGGAAFPDVVIILQGEGVTVNVVGAVNIRKGVTTSSFNSIPDVPIATFELKLPQGPHSGLGANLPATAKGSMCGQSLTMPTTLTGQNGAQVKQNTKITVTGCPRTKKAKAKKAKAKKRNANKHKKGSGKGK